MPSWRFSAISRGVDSLECAPLLLCSIFELKERAGVTESAVRGIIALNYARLLDFYRVSLIPKELTDDDSSFRITGEAF